MRDGEKFFAEGRDNANYELVQQQMKLAGTWRIGLRSAVLGQLAALGRRTPQMQTPGQVSRRMAGTGGGGGFGGGWDDSGIVNGPTMPASSPVYLGFQFPLEVAVGINGTELEQSFETSGGMDKFLPDYDLGGFAEDNKQKSLALDGNLSY